VTGVTRATSAARKPCELFFVRSLDVAIVSNDPDARLAAARAFDRAPASWSVSLHHERPDSADVVVLGPDVSGEGIRFDPDKAGGLIDEITRATARSGRLVVVTGVGRGVGTTTVALHLAAEFANDRDACFVDLDTTFGAADRLGLPEEHPTWRDIDDSVESLISASLPVAGGFRALLAARGDDPPEDLLLRSAEAFDRIVVDCPPDDPLDDTLSRAACAVVVIPASGLGIRRLDQVLPHFEGLPVALVVNRTGPGSDVTRSNFTRLAGHRCALELPCCGRLREAEDEGRLFTSPFSRWKWSMARLARVLEQV
jgi:hypothetical protein